MKVSYTNNVGLAPTGTSGEDRGKDDVLRAPLLWRPDHAGFDSRSIFEGALVEE